MRAKSWMAALGLIGVTSILIGRGLSAQGTVSAQKSAPSKDQERIQEMPSRADTPKPNPRAKAKASDSHFDRVQLNLVIQGLGAKGGDVEVKPANAGCKFRIPPPQHVPPEGQTKMDLKDVEIRGADHTCTVAITVREPGQPSKTVYRGFRLTNSSTTSSATASTIPTFTCYLSSRLAEVDKPRVRR
jgi:hypothetical protein